jgi:hypothetical protein
VWSISSCKGEEEKALIVPDFAISFADGKEEAPTTVLIENRTTGANAYAWIFEGGTPHEPLGEQPGPVRYDRPGTYTVTLMAYHDAEVETLTKSLTVRRPTNAVSSFSLSFASPFSDYAPAEVAFINESDHADSYLWSFAGGDPAASAESDPVVTFARYGLHEVTLTVSNTAGNSSVRTQSVKIYPGELRCNTPDEAWQASLRYPPLEDPIGYVQYHLAAERSAIRSWMRIYIPPQIFGQEVKYELPLNWDWIVGEDGKQQLRIELVVTETQKGVELSDFTLSEDGSFTLTATRLDDELQMLLSSEGAAALIPVLEQELTYSKQTGVTPPGFR